MFRKRILMQPGLWMACCLLPASGTQAQDSAKTKVATEAISPEQAFQSAQTFQIAGDYERAAEAYREAGAGARRQLGNLRVSHKEDPEAIELLARAVQIAPAQV